MSPVVNMRVDYEDHKDDDRFEPLPSATYKIQVRSIDQTKTGPDSKSPGRPMLLWWLEVIENPDHSGRRLPYNTVLAWENPMNPGKIDDSGLGLLVAACKGVKKPWTGRDLNTDEYLGLTGFVSVEQGIIGAGSRKGEPTNKVKFVTS